MLKSLKTFYKHPKVKHVLTLLKFFSFNVLLPGLDIYTDIQTATDYFRRNHLYWCFCTTLFIFLPLLGKILIFTCQFFFYSLKSSKEKKLKDLINKSSNLIWEFPPFMVLRYKFYL